MLKKIELLENDSILKGLRFPHKIKDVTQIVITAGQFSCLVDFHMWSLKAPAVALFLPGQVVESLEADDDFAGFGMVLKQDFTDSLNLPVSLQERLFIKSTQFYSVTEELLEALVSIYRQLSSLMNQPDNPYREEIIRHLFSAHYYGLLLFVAILCLVILMVRYSSFRPLRVIEPTYRFIYNFCKKEVFARLRVRRIRQVS